MLEDGATSPWRTSINNLSGAIDDAAEENTGNVVGSTCNSLTKPRFGGRIDAKITWVGGPPLSDWSGTSLSKLYSPACMRGIDAKTTLSMYHAHIKALTGKFKKGDVEFLLLAFAKATLEHMKEHGMDTIFYMKGVTV